MKRGDNTLAFIVVFAGILGLGVLALGYGPSIMRGYNAKQMVQEQMRRLGNMGEEEMVDSIIHLAKDKYKINIKPEDVEFEGDVGEMSYIRIEYNDEMNFIFTKRWRRVKIEMEFMIPDLYAG